MAISLIDTFDTHIGMSLVKINALAIPPQAGPAMVERFEAQVESLATVAGFEGFELLRPTGEDEPRWFVYTRWADEESYQAWRDGEMFAKSHKGDGPPAGGAPAGGPPAGAEGDRPGAHSGGHPGGEPPARPGKPTLLEFEVAVSAGPANV